MKARDSLKENEEPVSQQDSDAKPVRKISRRDFLKYGAGVTAVAVGATALMGKIPLPEDAPKRPAINEKTSTIVVSVKGDELTVMSGQSEVKLKDSGLAGEIASKIR